MTRHAAAASPHDGPGPDCGVGTKQTHMLAELLAFPKEVASRELVRSVSHSNINGVVPMARNHNQRNGAGEPVGGDGNTKTGPPSEQPSEPMARSTPTLATAEPAGKPEPGPPLGLHLRPGKVLAARRWNAS